MEAQADVLGAGGATHSCPGPRTWCRLWVLHTDPDARNNAFIALKTFLEAWREPGGPFSLQSKAVPHSTACPTRKFGSEMEGRPLPLWRDCEGHLGEAGVGGVSAQGAEGVNFCLGWKLREGVATSPPENVLSPESWAGAEKVLWCQLEGQGPGQGGSSPGPDHRPQELKEAPWRASLPWACSTALTALRSPAPGQRQVTK
uniref:Uncharacterized protein n=1 Tax=Myotis myotis TaxID=51298 RepID=A0A7J7XHN8_MYOMY|nr:hypothetical protein mMyoMyo1_011745 [Myotis myotis]